MRNPGEVLSDPGKLMALVLLAAVAFTLTAHRGILTTYLWDEDDFSYMGKAYASDSPGYVFDADTRIQGFPRPLTHLYFFVLSRLFGSAHTYYFLANMLLFAASAALLARLVLKLFDSWWVAVLCGILYFTGPCLVENLFWLAAGATGFVCSLFFLLSLNLYADFARGRSRLLLAGSILAAILAMAAKESAASLPLVLAMIELHLGDRGRRGLLCVLPFAAIVAAFFALEVSIQMTYPRGGNFSRYSFGWHVARNWMQLVLFPLAGPLPPHAGEIPWYKLVPISAAWLSPALLGSSRARRLTLFGLGWSFFTAIPFLGWETAITDAFVRYFNIPFMGSTLIIAGLVMMLGERFGRKAAIAGTVVILGLFGSFGMSWAYGRVEPTIRSARTELNIVETAREAWDGENPMYIGFFGLYEERIGNYNAIYFDNNLIQVDALPASPRPGALMLNGPTTDPKLLVYSDGGWTVLRRYPSLAAE